jgi:hypothetical protein
MNTHTILCLLCVGLGLFASISYSDLQNYREKNQRLLKSNIELSAKVQALKLSNRH